jgi:O-antigen/teichoic acid export membrane protein
MHHESLTGRTARATQWRLAGAVVGAVSQFVIGVLLARLLRPADFGLMALALVALGFMQTFSDPGIASALVQRVDVTDRHIRVAFTISLLFGLGAMLAMASAAPLVAALMREPDATAVLRALSVGLFVASTATVAEALLQRRLDFKSQSLIQTGSHLAGYGVVSVALAFLGYGVWSLVWGGLVQMLLYSGGQLVICRHSKRPLFARRELGELFHFGFWSTMNALVSYVALNADNFIVGRSIGAASLGLYSRAYSLMNVPHTFFASVLTNVLFPAFSQAQGDPARLARAYLLVTRLTAMAAAPAMATLVIVAPHLVPSLYGQQWTGMVIPLQILGAAGYFRAVYHLGGVVVRSVGWIYPWVLRQTGYAILVVSGALIGSRYGLPGVAVGVGIAIVYMFGVTADLALRATGTSWAVYLGVQRDAIATAAATSAVALLTRAAFEAFDVSSSLIVVAVLVAAAIPWSIGVVAVIGRPECAPLTSHLPVRLLQAVSVVRRLRPETMR